MADFSQYMEPDAQGFYQLPWGGKQMTAPSQAQFNSYLSDPLAVAQKREGYQPYITYDSNQVPVINYKQVPVTFSADNYDNAHDFMAAVNEYRNRTGDYSQNKSSLPASTPWRDLAKSPTTQVTQGTQTAPQGTPPAAQGTPAPQETPTAGQVPTQDGLIDIFQPDKYSSSWSGLPPEKRDELLNALLPRLLKSLEDYEGNIDKSTSAAQELFQSQTRNSMQNNLQGILNSLAGRNMLNSTVASDAIGRGMGDIARSGAEKGYETAMMNAGLKAQLPQLLSNITQLGSGGFSSDPLEPYKLLAQYDWNMM